MVRRCAYGFSIIVNLNFVIFFLLLNLASFGDMSLAWPAVVQLFVFICSGIQ